MTHGIGVTGSAQHRRRCEVLCRAIKAVLDAKPTHYRDVRPVLTTRLAAVPEHEAQPAVQPVDPQGPSSALCTICMDAPVEVVYIPCRHQACCTSCPREYLRQQHQCPICRSYIHQAVQPIVQGVQA